MRIAASLVLLAISISASAQWPGSTKPQSGKASNERYGAYKKGDTATGGDGCYFGECGDGKPIKDKPPKEEPKKEEREAPKSDEPDSRSDRTGRRTQVVETRICQTPGFWCTMYVSGPPGQPCYCNVPFAPGFVNGVTVPQR